jgi:Ferritin-like domain
MPRTTETDFASRRTLLAGAGLLIGAASLAAPAMAADAAGDVTVMHGALALEHEGIAAYRLAGASGLLQPDTLKVAVLFKGHHEQHRDALANLIRKAGGKPVEPKPDAAYVKELNLAALKTQGDVVMLATKLELGATNAYAGQVAALHDPQLAHLFAQLSADEAVHWTTLNNAAGTPLPAKAFIFG